MWRDDNSIPGDVASVVASLPALRRHASTTMRDLFVKDEPLIVARAPGRLDLLGGIADYSGSHVLQMPTGEACVVCLQTCVERTLTIVSVGESRSMHNSIFQLPMSAFEQQDQPITLAAAHRLLNTNDAVSWAAYIAGVVIVLMTVKRVRFECGLRIYIDSRVPEGKGVSSSAAVEVATMQALAEALQLRLDQHELALLCQQVENEVVGAPCGVMDQMTSSCGQLGKLLSLRCQPAQLLPALALPDTLAVWGIDSGVRHAVSGASYTSVRVAAFMGYRMILDLAGVVDKYVSVQDISDNRWHGYLANVPLDEFESAYLNNLPEVCTGAQFLQTFDGITDTVTEIDPDACYRVRDAAAFPVSENARVRQFAEWLQHDHSAHNEALGTCLYQSHAGYSACGLGADGTDQLIALARAAGIKRGVFGARISGGGNGGTVVLLTAADAGDVVHSIAADYAEQAGRGGYVFAGSSDGARAWTMQPMAAGG